ncbi:MAG: CueP family metal-binding protein [Nocardioides sp.]|nr:CueP family metal-binding protein [Nocardioides sp.]
MSKHLLALCTAAALALTGCASAERNNNGSADAETSSSSSGLDSVLKRHRLDEMGPAEMIDRLDRLSGENRPTDLVASVLPDRLVLSGGGEEMSLDIPRERFYLSVAPYAERTHACHNHSLTTCTGELPDQDVAVKVIDQATGEVLMDESRTTFSNGFVGLWLPRDIHATLTITSEGARGQADISTTAEAPTCLTTLRLT